MKKKKYALALLTLAIGASLFGCGNKEASENKADTEAGAEVTESNKEEKAEDSKEDSKKKKQYSYRWTGAWVEGGYDGSFTAADAEVQQMIESNNDALEDAIIACAAYHLTDNYLTGISCTDEIFNERSVYDSQHRYALNDHMFYEDQVEPIRKLTDYSADGKEYYILNMRSCGNGPSALARVEVSEDGIIRYAGDNLLSNMFNNTMSAIAKGVVDYMVATDIDMPDDFWFASTDLANELRDKNYDTNAKVQAQIQKIIDIYGGEITLYGIYVDELNEEFSEVGNANDELLEYLDKDHERMAEGMEKAFSNWGVTGTIKTKVFVYQIDETAEISKLDIVVDFSKMPDDRYLADYTLVEAYMQSLGYKCLGYKEY